MKKTVNKKEKVFWSNETKNPSYSSLPFGIYHYNGDEVVHVEWYKTAEERDQINEKGGGV